MNFQLDGMRWNISKEAKFDLSVTNICQKILKSNVEWIQFMLFEEMCKDFI